MKQQLNFKTYSGFETKALETTEPTKEGEGVIYIEGYASKSYDMGKPVIDRDGEWVDIKGFDLSTCTSLLFNHNGEDIKIGKCRLEHRADGAYLYGEVHEKLNDKVYYAVKHEIMTDFSIGFSATDYEFKTIEGKDVLTFTEGFVWETSIVNIIGSNPKAKIETTKKLRQDKKMLELAKWLGDTPNEVQLETYTEVKSIIQDGKCVGFSCDMEQLKKANPEQDCSCITKDMDMTSTSTSEDKVMEITTAEGNATNRNIVATHWNLGPEKTSQDSTANSEYWDKMGKIWNIPQEEARRRLCANCEYYDNTPKAMQEMEAIPLDEFDIDGGGRGYCHKFEFICHNLRTCQAWEEKEFIQTDEEIEKGLKLNKLQEIMKGLTFEQTEADGYNQLRQLRLYMEILEETLSDNFYEIIWSEGLSGEEAKANIIGAISAFTNRIDEFSILSKPAEPTNVTKTKGKKDMKVKSVEANDVVETAPVTEEVILEGEEQTSNPEQVEDNTPEQISTETNEEVAQADIAVTPTEVVEEVPSEEVSTKLTVEYLASVNIEELSDEQVEELYNDSSELIDTLMKDEKVQLLASASDILEKIEALVKAEIQ